MKPPDSSTIAEHCGTSPHMGQARPCQSSLEGGSIFAAAPSRIGPAAIEIHSASRGSSNEGSSSHVVTRSSCSSRSLPVRSAPASASGRGRFDPAAVRVENAGPISSTIDPAPRDRSSRGNLSRSRLERASVVIAPTAERTLDASARCRWCSRTEARTASGSSELRNGRTERTRAIRRSRSPGPPIL